MSESPESNLSEKDLRDVVLNFVIAGRDTTAATLSWCIYMIITHPHVSERVYSELRAFEEERAKEEGMALVTYQPENPEFLSCRMAQFADLLTYDSLGRLSYLHATITETLRLYPAVPQVSKLHIRLEPLLPGQYFYVSGNINAPLIIGNPKPGKNLGQDLLLGLD